MLFPSDRTGAPEDRTTKVRLNPTRQRLLVCLVACVLLASCSIERRYRVLDFFFDGVPDPNAPARPVGPTEPRVDFAKLTSAERAEYLTNKIEAPTVYFHDPVQKRECDACHVFEKQDDSKPGWMAGMPTLIVPIEDLCARCHEPPEGKYVHGPVATGRCDFCHEPHQSTFPHLLRAETVDKVCLACHSGETFVTQVEHGDLGEASCTTCHDPHASERKHFLFEFVTELGSSPSPQANEGE